MSRRVGNEDAAMIYSLPVIGKKEASLPCGDCQECCVAFPLLAEEGFWPQKPAHQPCRFLCAQGCSIHAQPRPKVCTQFQCCYAAGWLGDAPRWRPDKAGVIVYAPKLEVLFPGPWQRWQAHFPVHWKGTDGGIGILECRPGALLQLEADKVRYWLNKFRQPWHRLIVVLPYGIDPLGIIAAAKAGRDAAAGAVALNLRLRKSADIAVWWSDDRSYADAIVHWWEGRQAVSVTDVEKRPVRLCRQASSSPA
jgi:hypothetical protein